MMETSELNSILYDNSATSRYFIGTFPACEFPITKRQKYCFVTNTDRHDGAGKHWNSWFVCGDKLYFFDSFGRQPQDKDFPNEYNDFIKKFNIVEYTKTPIQAPESMLCGMFCVHFIYVMSFGLNFMYFLSEYYNFLKLNDYVVFKFINSIQ